MPGDGEAAEVQRAAVLFPRFFLWLIGSLLSGLLLLGGVVVAQVRTTADTHEKKMDIQERTVNDHESRLRVLEQGQKDLKDVTKETNQDVKEIRRLLEQQVRRKPGSVTWP